MLQPDKNKKKDNIATRADSLAVYNSGVKTLNAYNTAKFKGKKAYKIEASRLEHNIHADNDALIKRRKELNINSDFDPFLDKDVKHNYRTTIDKNRYIQKETADHIVNTSIPGQLFDRRVAPRSAYYFSPNNTDKDGERIKGNTDPIHGDWAAIYSYANIANKPFDLLTEKEKAERVKKYGRDGVPSSYGKSKNNISTSYTNKVSGTYTNKVPDTYIAKVKEKGTKVNPVTIAETKLNANNNTTVKVVPKKAKSYKVETEGGSKFGAWKNTSTISNAEQLSAEKGNKRTITPIYVMGGKINTTNIMEKPRLESRKRHIAPAIIGAGVNIGVGLIQGMMQKDAAKKARKSALNQMWQEKSVSDAQELVDYNTQGEYVDYYADGGQLPNKPNTTSIGKYQTKGGKLKPIGDGVSVAEGNKHSEKRIDNSYGITLHQQGKPIAEVEDDEVLVEQGDGTDMVYSEQLTDEKGVSFAKRMKQLTAKRNKLDKKLETTKDSISRNTVERQLAGLNMAEELLTQKQEMAKMIEGQKELDNLAYGGKVKKYDNGTSPDDTIGEEESFNFMKELAPTLIDNVGNIALTAFTPKLPKPILAKAERISTNYNANPQLAEVKGQTRAMVDNIYANSSNSNVTRANVASARLRGLEATNNILAQKENIETGLRNQNVMNKQAVNSKNTDTLNSNNLMEFTRANDIQSRISSNLADMSGDITETLERKDKTLRDEEIMQILLSDDPTGARAKAMAKVNPKYAKYLKSTMQGRQYFKNKLNADVFGRANVGANVFRDKLASNPFN